MNDGVMALAVSDARDAARGEPDIKERFRKAAFATKDHWMLTGYEARFKAALAGAMMESDEADRERYQYEFDGMARLAATITALQNGVPVDLEKMVDEMPPNPPERIGLREIWLEVAGERR
jgi:hypothetical protein